MMLIDEPLAKRLTKAQLIELIAYCLELSDLKKADLLTLFLGYIDGNELWQRKILKKFPESFAICPSRFEKMLGITPTERIRWTKGEVLPVVPDEWFKKHGFDLSYPTYDYFETLKILQKNKVEQWRSLPKEFFNKKSTTNPTAKVAIEPKTYHQTFSQEDYMDGWYDDSGCDWHDDW